MAIINRGLVGIAALAAWGCPALAGGPVIDDLKLVASDPVIGDEFGSEVSINAGWAVIGAPRDNIFGANSGSAYVFVKGAGGFWFEDQKITPSTAMASANFGAAVAMGDGFLIAGAPVQAPGGVFRAGTAYVFEYDGQRWFEADQFLPPDLAGKDRMGTSAAVSGDVAVIGAPGDGFFDFVLGKVFVYRREANGFWNYETTLYASDAADNDHFGASVAIDGDRIVVGADRNDDGGSSSGSAYVFDRQLPSGQWVETAKLVAPDASSGDQFGNSIAVSGDLIAVGAFRDDTDSGITNTGSVYLFEESAFGGWAMLQRIDAGSGMVAYDAFGSSVALEGSTVFVGAPTEASPLVSAGKAYRFERPIGAGTWVKTLTLEPSDGEPGDFFGDAVAFDGLRAMVGARWDDTTEDNAGSATVFSFVEECVGDLNGDAVIDTADLGVLIADFGMPSIRADLNGDGIVDTADLGVLISVFGQDCE